MKKTYEKPQLTELGSVAQLTQAGRTNPGEDCKMGSNQNMNCN
jgi:hypothetical protein